MRTSLLIFLLFCASAAVAAQENRCILGLTYGMSRDSVETELKKQHSVLLAQQIVRKDNIDLLTYYNCKIEGCNAKSLNLYFVDGKLSSTEATFRPHKNILFKVYTHLLKSIVTEHGNPNAMNTKNLNLKNIGGEHDSFWGGKIAIWVFPQKDRIYSINLQVVENREIKLDYIENR